MVVKAIFLGVSKREVVALKNGAVMKTDIKLSDPESGSANSSYIATIWGNKGSEVDMLSVGDLVNVDMSLMGRESGKYYSMYAKVNAIGPADASEYLRPYERIGLDENYDELGKLYYTNRNGFVVDLARIKAYVDEIGKPVFGNMAGSSGEPSAEEVNGMIADAIAEEEGMRSGKAMGDDDGLFAGGDDGEVNDLPF